MLMRSSRHVCKIALDMNFVVSYLHYTYILVYPFQEWIKSSDDSEVLKEFKQRGRYKFIEDHQNHFEIKLWYVYVFQYQVLTDLSPV